jgi:DGQHR domain-containing protein
LEKHRLSLGEIFDERKNELNLSRIKERASRIQPKADSRKGKIAFVIDGQHRLRAFEYCDLGKFPLVVSALIDLSLAEVAEIFVKINYYQKAVNKSLVLDLLGISERIFPQYYKLHELVERLNDDIASPFYRKIRMLGLGTGFISQASIISSIEKYKIEKTLHELNIKPTKEELYNLIWNYFKGVEEVFPQHWGDGKYLSKTIGIRALFLLMRDVLETVSNRHIDFSKKNIKNILCKIDKDLFDIPDIRGLGGEKGVKLLYQRMKTEIEED